MSEDNNLIKLSSEDLKEWKGYLTQIGEQYKNVTTQIVTLGKANSDTIEKIEKITENMVKMQEKYEAEFQKRLDSLEVDLKKYRGGDGAFSQKFLGEMFIQDEAVKAALKRGGRDLSASLNIKAAITQFYAKDIVNVPKPAQDLGLVVTPPRLPLGVRSLIPQGRTSAGAVEYVREDSFTNNAAPVTEGTLKPQSEKVISLQTAVIRTLAHFFVVTTQALDDLPFLSSLISQNGIYGIQKVEDGQLLNGTNVAPQLDGLMRNAVAAPAPVDQGDIAANLIDALGVAAFDLAAKGYAADGFVVNPADWGTVALIKNSLGNYIFANPMDYSPSLRMWGMRGVMSTNMTAGDFLAGSFQGHSLLVDREDVNVAISYEDADNFRKNMATVRIEERLALLVLDPAAFEKGEVPVATP